jgi:hypothetical protein
MTEEPRWDGVVGRADGLTGRWDAALLVPVAEINELMLEVLRAAAHASGPRPALIESLHELWLELDIASQQRLARCPYLLLDAAFAAPARWERAALERGVVGREILDAGVMDAGGSRSCFASRAGIALVRRTLLFAWHLARSNRLSARVLLGMSAECAERIGAIALRELEALAELCPEWIAPRWAAQPLIWRQLLQAALGGQQAALGRVQARGWQLLATPHPGEPSMW